MSRANSSSIQVTSQTPLTTKGDLLAHDTDLARLPVGTNDQVLTADSTQALGVKWADAAGGGNSTLYIKSADETKTSTTSMAADTDMTFATEANSVYYIQVHVFHLSHSTPDFKYRYQTTAGDIGYYWQATGGNPTIITNIRSNSGVTGSIRMFVEKIRLTTGGTPATFQFTWAQNTSSTEATTLLKGSYLEVFKVG